MDKLTKDLIDVCRRIMRDDRRASSVNSAGFLPTETRVALLEVLCRCPRTGGRFAIQLDEQSGGRGIYYDGEYPCTRDEAAIYRTVADAEKAMEDFDEPATVVPATWLT